MVEGQNRRTPGPGHLCVTRPSFNLPDKLLCHLSHCSSRSFLTQSNLYLKRKEKKKTCPGRKQISLRGESNQIWRFEENILEKSLISDLKNKKRTSLVVQWVGFHAPNAGGQGSILDQGIRSHMPQLKNIHRL